MTLNNEYFKIIKSAGFSELDCLSDGQITPKQIHLLQLKKIFLIEDWAIQAALDNNLAIVVNIHHFEEIFNQQTIRKNSLACEAIADRYKDYPDDVIFEMLNEPHKNLTSDIWNEFLSEGISLIREIDNKRTLMIGPANWNSINSLNSLQVPDDGNIIITVH